MRKIRGINLAIIILSGMLISVFIFGYIQVNDNKIAKNTYIKNVDIGKLSKEEAKEKIKNECKFETITFTYKDKEGNEVSNDEITEGIEKAKEEEPFYKNAPIDMKLSITERNFDKESLKLNYTATDVLGKTIEDAKATSSEWYEKTKTFKFDKEANYTLNSIEYTDLAGNSLKEAYGQHYFTVDKTAPIGKVLIGKEEQKVGILGKAFGFIYSFFSNE